MLIIAKKAHSLYGFVWWDSMWSDDVDVSLVPPPMCWHSSYIYQISLNQMFMFDQS